jgi:hypothetical protein
VILTQGNEEKRQTFELEHASVGHQGATSMVKFIWCHYEKTSASWWTLEKPFN